GMLFHGSGSIDECKFTMNTAIARNSTIVGNGGALFVLQSPNLNVSQCNFNGNSAEGGGGAAAFFESRSVVLVNSTFVRNSCVGDDQGGGAILIEATDNFGGGSITLSDNVIGGSTVNKNFTTAAVNSLAGGGG